MELPHLNISIGQLKRIKKFNFYNIYWGRNIETVTSFEEVLQYAQRPETLAIVGWNQGNSPLVLIAFQPNSLDAEDSMIHCIGQIVTTMENRLNHEKDDLTAFLHFNHNTKHFFKYFDYYPELLVSGIIKRVTIQMKLIKLAVLLGDKDITRAHLKQLRKLINVCLNDVSRDTPNARF